jgi:hypothetical protein
LILDSLSKDIDNLEIVQSLRSQSYNLHNDTALRSGPGISSGGGGGRKISAYKGWLELDLEFGRENEGKKGILGTMRGTRGLGVQRAFWNAETKEMVAVVWIGGGLSGWPGVAHGGAIATVFEEIMARMVRGPEGIVGMYTNIVFPTTTSNNSPQSHLSRATCVLTQEQQSQSTAQTPSASPTQNPHTASTSTSSAPPSPNPTFLNQNLPQNPRLNLQRAGWAGCPRKRILPRSRSHLDSKHRL